MLFIAIVGCSCGAAGLPLLVNREEESHRALSSGSAWTPLRIVPSYDDSLIQLSSSKLAFLRDTLVPQSLVWWQASLSVPEVDGNMMIPPPCQEYHPNGICKALESNPACGSGLSGEPLFPVQHLAAELICTSCVGADCSGDSAACYNTTAGSGVDGNYILYVTASETTSCSDSIYPAGVYAETCASDKVDRPVAGRINFCPSSSLFASIQDAPTPQQVGVVEHEIGQALGFNIGSLAYFRDANGVPRTPRNAAGKVETSLKVGCPNSNDVTFAQPANNTVQYFLERGEHIAKIVTPTVLKVAQNFFGCHTLNGAELATSSSAQGCFQMEWHPRLFHDDVMSAAARVGVMNPIHSALTLAYFEDSGWYKADFEQTVTSGWGHQEGCDFARQRCIDSNTPVGHPFCTSNSGMGEACSADYRSIGQCNMMQFLNNLPLQYQYFTSPKIGGPAQSLDYCPYYEPFAQTWADCVGGSATPLLPLSKFGHDSICVRSSLGSSVGQQSKINTGCFAHYCADGKVTILVEDKAVSCVNDDDVHELDGYSGQITCPPANIICAHTICPHQCSGHGECASSSCTCHVGYTGEACSQRVCPNSCSGHGSCSVAATCVCDTNYSGEDCSILPEWCSNAAQDQDESDIDCGGGCNPCVAGKQCTQAQDCSSGDCQVSLVCGTPAPTSAPTTYPTPPTVAPTPQRKAYIITIRFRVDGYTTIIFDELRRGQFKKALADTLLVEEVDIVVGVMDTSRRMRFLSSAVTIVATITLYDRPKADGVLDRAKANDFKTKLVESLRQGFFQIDANKIEFQSQPTFKIQNPPTPAPTPAPPKPPNTLPLFIAGVIGVFVVVGGAYATWRLKRNTQRKAQERIARHHARLYGNAPSMNNGTGGDLDDFDDEDSDLLDDDDDHYDGWDLHHVCSCTAMTVCLISLRTGIRCKAQCTSWPTLCPCSTKWRTVTIKLEIAPNQELYNPDDMKTVDAVFVAKGSFGATLIKSLADLEQVKFGQEARNDLHKGYEEDGRVDLVFKGAKADGKGRSEVLSLLFPKPYELIHQARDGAPPGHWHTATSGEQYAPMVALGLKELAKKYVIPLKVPNSRMRNEERTRREKHIKERLEERQAISQWMALARTENRRLLYHSTQIGEYKRRTSFAEDTKLMMNKAATKVSGRKISMAGDTLTVGEKKIQV